jgi:hypothetical protein
VPALPAVRSDESIVVGSKRKESYRKELKQFEIEARFHMPEEDALFDVRIHFIHVVSGLKVIEGAG